MDNEILVHTLNGKVCGEFEESEYGSKFYNFRGIPYAKPPIGPLRFLPPVPSAPWTGVLDGTIRKETSMYIDYKTHEILGSEDCLYLNIHTSKVKRDKPVPVMVWIGSWVFSYNHYDWFSPGRLTDQDIVFVHLSYRLGPFGFLSICEATAPGNCGLKDVVLALQWIQKNISAFGGDPNNVTLFGSASGSSVVHYMTLSPMATGLFHKVILQSGCALNNWALSRYPLFVTKALTQELDIMTEDLSEAVDKLRKMPALDIMKAFHRLNEKRTDKGGLEGYDAIFKPCVETEFEGQTAFMTKNPYTILKSGKINKVPMIIGNNKREGAMVKCIKDLSSCYELYNNNVEILVPRELSVESNKSKNIGFRLLQFYLEGDKIREETLNQYYQFLTDYYFIYYVNKSVKLHSEHCGEFPVYYYIFQYQGDFQIEHELIASDSHMAELPYMFQIGDKEYYGSRESKKTRERIIRLWTNFAKFGNPTPDEDDKLLQITWDQVHHEDKLLYLDINTELTKGCNPFYDRMSFWDGLLDETAFLRASAYFDTLDRL